MSVHILGTGAIGCHIASVLHNHKIKVKLLLRSQDHLNDFRNRNNTITYRCQGKSTSLSGFDSINLNNITDNQPISSLIVATKAHHTLNALKPIVSKLSPDSTILLLQNGMGVAEELVEKIWPNQVPPTIMVGINRHAVERIAPYDICHHSGYDRPETLSIGRFPLGDNTNIELGQSELVKSIVEIPELSAKELPWEEVKIKMMKKLIINACINPLASLMMCQNKGVLSRGGNAMMKSVCQEAYDVLKSDLPNESVESLMKIVLDMLEEAGENTCSMLQDFKGKRITEIDYINGYICKLGKQKNLGVKSNQALVDLIHAKESLY